MKIKSHHQLLFVLSLIYIIPLIRANVLFADDLWRTFSGYTGYLENGRFGAEALVIMISSGIDIADASPFTQILAAVIFSLSGYIFYNYANKSASILSKVLVSQAFLITPSTLEQLSFRFDSLTMSVSVLLSVFSFVVFQKNAKGLILSLALFILSMSFYQTSLGLCIGIIFLHALINKDECLKNMAIRISLIFFGYIFYSKGIIPLCGISDHAIVNGGIISINRDGLRMMLSNIENFNKMTFGLFRSKDGYIYYLTILAAIIPLVINVMSSSNKPSSFIRNLLLIISIFMLSLFPMSLLSNPMFQPRVMFIYPVIMMLALHGCTLLNWKNTGCIISLLIILHSYIFMSIYSNTLRYQYDNNLRFSSVLERTLDDIGYNPKVEVSFQGVLNQPPTVERVKHNYKIVSAIMQDYFNGNYVLGFAFLRNNNVLIKNTDGTESKYQSDDMPMVSSNRYGQLFKTKEGYLFKFYE